jgi:hypothetical protein
VHESVCVPGKTCVSHYMAGTARALQYWHSSEHPCFAPIMKMHREPLQAIASLVAGFNGDGGCSSASHRFSDLVSWKFASKYVWLPGEDLIQLNISPLPTNMTPCGQPRHWRIRLALHYWVKWNVLSDSVSRFSFQIEDADPLEMLHTWCNACRRNEASCNCPLDDMHEKQRRDLEFRFNESLRSNHPHHINRHRQRTTTITWAELWSIDENMTSFALQLSNAYGYNNELV